MTDTSNAAADIAQAMSVVFNTANRNGSSTLASASGCALLGNSALVNPNFGDTLLNPAGITPLTNLVTLSALGPEEQAQLATNQTATVYAPYVANSHR